MTENDYKNMGLLMRSNQRQTKAIMKQFLSKYYPAEDITETKDFIYCKGNIDIGLVAHLDCVAEENRGEAELYWDREKKVMFCPGYPGFDDKAGLYSIVKIVQRGFLPTVMLCCDEESGGYGAIALALHLAGNEPDLRYLIELDRANEKDCVFYQCDSKNFIKYVESFGFTFAEGSFTDIVFLMDAWEIPGVNLSCGYLDEHSYYELLHTDWMEETIEKVIIMLQSKSEKFKYEERKADLLSVRRDQRTIL